MNNCLPRANSWGTQPDHINDHSVQRQLFRPGARVEVLGEGAISAKAYNGMTRRRPYSSRNELPGFSSRQM